MSINHEHNQPTPADVWTINHGLGGLTNIDVIIEEDGVRQKVLVDRVVVVDENNVEIRFNQPRVGKARIQSLGEEPTLIFDDYTIVDVIDYYPAYEYRPMSTYPYRPNTPGNDNDAPIVVSPQDGKVYSVSRSGTVGNSQGWGLTVQRTAGLEDNTVEVSHFFSWAASGIAMRNRPKDMCVWNDVVYFITHDEFNSLNNPQSNGSNDFRVYRVDMAAGTISDQFLFEFAGPGNFQGISGIDTDGEFLYLTTFIGSWLKCDINTFFGSGFATEVKFFSDYFGTFGLPSNFRPGACMYDFDTGYFSIPITQSTRENIAVFDSFAGTLLAPKQGSARIWFETDNWFIHGATMSGTQNRNVSYSGYKYGNTDYPFPAQSTAGAQILCQETEASIRNIQVNLSNLTGGFFVRQIYLSQFDGKVYAMSSSQRLFVFTSLFDLTLEATIIHQTNLPNNSNFKFCVHDGILHVVSNSTYVRYDATTGAELARFAINSMAGQTNGRYIVETVDVFNGELIFIAKDTTVIDTLRPFRAPLNFTDQSQVVLDNLQMRFFNRFTGGSAVDSVTGHIYATFSTGGVTYMQTYHSTQGTQEVRSISGAQNSSVNQYPLIYGNAIFDYQFNGRIQGLAYRASQVPAYAVNNFICDL